MDKYAQRGLNMHKLILSIIAVAFLQIGFITYVTTNQTADNARLTGVKTQSVNPAGNPTYTAEDDPIEVASFDEDPFFRRETAEPRGAKTPRFLKSGYAVRRKTARTVRKVSEQPEPFVPEQITITYAVHRPYKFVEREPYRNMAIDNSSIVNRSENVEQALTKSQKSDGNPFLNVIKKPYTWIKALGSKLK